MNNYYILWLLKSSLGIQYLGKIKQKFLKCYKLWLFKRSQVIKYLGQIKKKWGKLDPPCKTDIAD